MAQQIQMKYMKNKISKEFLEMSYDSSIPKEFSLPDEKFRFITYEQNDYKKGMYTVISYGFIPDSVFVTIPVTTMAEMFNIIMDIMSINKPNKFYLGNSRACGDDFAENRLTQQLKVII